MKNIPHKKIIASSILFFTLIGIIFSLNSPNVYSSKAQVALFRIKIENPDSASDESRNRWIWIRDGLNLKSAIVTDELLEEIITTDSTAKEINTKAKNKYQAYAELKKFIDIQFTGGDENNFLVETKSPNSALSYQLNEAIVSRIKYLFIDDNQKNFNSIIDELRNLKNNLGTDNTAQAFYEDKIRKLTLAHTIEQKQKENAFKIISHPSQNDIAVWPNKQLIVLVFLFIGIVVGNGIIFISNIFLNGRQIKNDHA